jgi:hypothetical protein
MPVRQLLRILQAKKMKKAWAQPVPVCGSSKTNFTPPMSATHVFICCAANLFNVLPSTIPGCRKLTKKASSLAEQMRDHPNVHVIRRHLGGIKLPEVDFRLRIDNEEDSEESMNNQGFPLEPGDTILMCTVTV